MVAWLYVDLWSLSVLREVRRGFMREVVGWDKHEITIYILGRPRNQMTLAAGAK